jgi:hypothetical protein
MFCSNCGRKLSDDAKFCDGCGQAVISAKPPAEAAGVQPSPVPAQPGTIPAQTLPGAVPAQTLPGTNRQGGPPPPGMPPGGMPMAPPKKKKRGCLIAFIIVAVLALVAAGGFLIWLLGDTPSGGGTGAVTDGTVQGVDVADLMTPADMRGTGMTGYWVLEGLSDQQGQIYEETEDAMVLYLGEDGTCAIRSDDGTSIEEMAGEWRENLMILHDDEGMDFELSAYLIDGDLYVNMGEEFMLCFRGPYTEDALLYQCAEYFKAASFMTSSLLENPEEMDLTYAQWDYGMDRAVEYWNDLVFTSSALDVAIDRYLAETDEEAQAMKSVDWLVNVLDLFKPLDVYGASYSAEEVNAVLDRAAQGQKIKTLASHFNITAQEAASIVFQTQSEISRDAYKDEMFYAKCEKTCRVIKTGSKVGVFICGTIASGGATGIMSAGEGAAFLIQGADMAMEINEEAAYIAYEIEGKQSAKKALEGIQNIRSVTAPAASIVGLKDLNGTGFDKFMLLKDTAFDAQEGKVLAIQVTDSSTGKMEVAHVTPEQLAQWKQDKGAEPTKLTEQDKKDVWAEIWAKVEEMEEKERLEAEANATPAPDAATEPAKEPTAAPEEPEEPPIEETDHPDIEGVWVVYAGSYYNGVWTNLQDDEDYDGWIRTFTFYADDTVDIETILPDGEIIYQSTGREGHWEGNIFYIEPVTPDAYPNSYRQLDWTIKCIFEEDRIIVEWPDLRNYQHALRPLVN